MSRQHTKQAVEKVSQRCPLQAKTPAPQRRLIGLRDLWSRPSACSGGLVRFVREPLVHFLLLGAALYWVASPSQRSVPARQTRIEVPAAEVRRMREEWTMQWHRPPRPRELQNLIDEYVREEVLYREAMAMGLDRNDDVVRRRLVQKMEFLEQSGSAAPTEVPD